MTKLESARERLTQALDALERSVDELARAKARALRDAADLEQLRSERDRLLARIGELEEENRALANLTEEVEGRIDGAIAEIRSALGN